MENDEVSSLSDNGSWRKAVGPSGETRAVREEVAKRVWIAAGGRCTFCNRYLLVDETTGEEVLIGQLAHIVGWTTADGSPRGHDALRAEQRNEAENLMLLCHDQHRVIDSRSLWEVYDADTLRRMKRHHEGRIRQLTSLRDNQKSTVLRVVGALGDRPVTLDQRAVTSALLDRDLFPNWALLGLDAEFELDLRQLGVPESNPTYWGAATSHIEHLGRRVRDKVAAGEGEHVSLLALARIPVLVAVGAALGETTKVSLYPHRRTGGEGFGWTEGATTVTFDSRKARDGDTSTVAIVVSVSGPVDLSLVEAAVGDDATIYEVHVTSGEPGTEVISSQESVDNFARTWRSVLSAPRARPSGSCGCQPLPGCPGDGRSDDRQAADPRRTPRSSSARPVGRRRSAAVRVRDGGVRPMKLTEYFKDFLDATVNLNDSRIDTLDRRVAAITSFLANDATFRDYFIDVLPQGSYAHRTIIKPVGNREYDADVLLVMEEHPSWTPAQYTLELRRAFNQSATYKDMAHMRSRCVYIDYADAFHVDVVPFVASRSSITYNKGGWDGQGSWHPSRPEDFALWLEQKYRVVGGGRLPAVIRLLKYLRDFKTTFSVKSVILTILVCNVVSDTKTLLDPAYYADLPTAFVHVLEDLASYLKTNPTMPAIRDPGNSGTNFSERWDQAGFENFSSCIQMYATKSRAALDATTVDASLKAWQEIFGSSFNKTVKKAITAAAAVPDIAPLEQFIDQDLRIPVRLTERVRLVGRVRQSGIQRAYDLPIRADRVDKGRTIDFRLEDCSVTGDFEVYWKTRNYGEVSTPEEMRGQIVKGGTSHTEQTRWRGTDYVEVYIVKDGVCVASDRQQVIITNRK